LDALDLHRAAIDGTCLLQERTWTEAAHRYKAIKDQQKQG
jgi:hypothetical protein